MAGPVQDITEYTMKAVMDMKPLKGEFKDQANPLHKYLSNDIVEIRPEFAAKLRMAFEDIKGGGSATIDRSVRNFAQIIDAMPSSPTAKAIAPDLLQAVRGINQADKNGALEVTPDVERIIDSAGPASGKVSVYKPPAI